MDNLVGLPKFADLAIHRLHLGRDIGGHSWSLSAVSLRLDDPAMQRLWRAADLVRDRRDRRLSRAVFALVIQHHPNRPRAHFRCNLVRRLARYRSTLSRVGASGKPGAV